MKTNQATTDYRHIVFLQGDEANSFLDILDTFGIEKTIEALLEYDTCPESCRHTNYNPAGSSDTSFCTSGGYELTWNYKLGYIGLCEVTKLN